MSLTAIAALASGGIQIGSAIYDSIQKRKRIKDLSSRRFSSTEYGRELNRTSREGDLSERDEAILMSKTSRATAQSAQDARQAYMRQAVSAGIDPNSISAARGLNEIEASRSGILADQAENIALSESTARRRAREEYARQATGFKLEKEAAIDELKYGSSAGTAKALASGAVTALSGADMMSMENQLTSKSNELSTLLKVKMADRTMEQREAILQLEAEIEALYGRRYGQKES